MIVWCGFHNSVDVFGYGAIKKYRVVNVEVAIQVVTVDDGGQSGSTEGIEDGPRERTLRDTTQAPS